MSLLQTIIILYIFFGLVFIFQLKNAFDNLFEGLMQSKDGEKEPAEVSCVAYYCPVT